MEKVLGGGPVKRPHRHPRTLKGGPGMILKVNTKVPDGRLRQDHVRIQFFATLPRPGQQRLKQSLLRKIQNGVRQQSWTESTKCGIAQLVNEEVRLSVQEFYSIQLLSRASGAPRCFSSVLQVRSAPNYGYLLYSQQS